MSQTTYANDPPVGYHGQEYDCAFQDHISAVAAEDIPFGSLVVRGASDGLCKLPAAATDITNPGSVLGIALFESSYPNRPTDTVAGFKAGARVTILHLGRARIKFEDNVVSAAALYVRFAGTGTKGAFRSDADGTNAALLANARAFKGANAALGIVEINKVGA
jgi:hypothetical protein